MPDYEYVVDAQDQDQAQAERMADTYNNGTGKTIAAKAQNHHLAMCAKHMNNYDDRTNINNGMSGNARQAWEDIAYKRAMMHAAYAQADAQTRQAEALESLLEFVGDLIGATDLIDSLTQWGYGQRAG